MDISVIIVNWNTKDLLKKCLVSVYETINFCDFEVIVVDNASPDGSAEMPVQNISHVIITRNKETLGFGTVIFIFLDRLFLQQMNKTRRRVA